MPVSKKRDKKQSVKVPRNVGKVSTENPAWLLPTAVTLLILGPAWIIVYYISKGAYPLRHRALEHRNRLRVPHGVHGAVHPLEVVTPM